MEKELTEVRAEAEKKELPPKKLKTKKTLLSGPGAKVFVFTMLIYAVINWLIFYVYANVDSILLAFKEFKILEDGTGQQVFLPLDRLFENFVAFFKGLLVNTGNHKTLNYFLLGGVYQFGWILVAYPVSLIFAYLIYKKLFLHNFFKVMLFMPSIVSGMVISILFKFGVESILPEIIPSLKGVAPLTDESVTNYLLVGYAIFFGMPGSLVVNTSMMSTIPDDVIEYGKLEGITMSKEFIHVIVPLMYPLITVQCLGIFTGFFTQSGPLYNIYAEKAPTYTYTFGYYMFTRVVGNNASEAYYGFTAAANLMIGLISIPIVYGTKWLLERFDPEAEF